MRIYWGRSFLFLISWRAYLFAFIFSQGFCPGLSLFFSAELFADVVFFSDLIEVALDDSLSVSLSELFTARVIASDFSQFRQCLHIFVFKIFSAFGFWLFVDLLLFFLYILLFIFLLLSFVFGIIIKIVENIVGSCTFVNFQFLEHFRNLFLLFLISFSIVWNPI